MFKYFLKILPQFIQTRTKFHKLLHFAFNGSIVLLLWLLFYEIFRYRPFVNNLYELGTHYLTQSFLVCTKLFMQLFSFELSISGKTLNMTGVPGVFLDRGCLGRNVMGLYAGFIIIYPGNFISKLWYIPLGLVAIYFLNVLRIAGLLLTQLYFPDYMDINHHLVFKYAVYSLIFLMWYFWIKKYGK